MRPFPNVLHHLTSPWPVGTLLTGFFYELLISFMALEFKFHVFFSDSIFEFLYVSQAIQDIVEGLVFVLTRILPIDAFSIVEMYFYTIPVFQKLYYLWKCRILEEDSPIPPSTDFFKVKCSYCSIPRSFVEA